MGGLQEIRGGNWKKAQLGFVRFAKCCYYITHVYVCKHAFASTCANQFPALRAF